MLKIVYWSDFVCPYCYIGETNLKQAIKELGIENVNFEMKAFQLDPFASSEYTGETADRFSKKYGISLEKAKMQIQKISDLGKGSGLDFNYATTRFTNTLDAHRLTKYIRKEFGNEMASQYIEYLFKSYFSDNQELSNKDVLLKGINLIGLNIEDARKVLESSDYLEDVKVDENMAQMLNIHGVPDFLINGYHVNGCLSVDNFKKLLIDITDSKETTGHRCGPNGCEI